MNNIFSYIDKKSELTQDIIQLYQNSLIFIRDEQQIYQPLIDTYIGIGKTEFENTKNNILSYSKQIYVNDIIPADQSGQNTSYFFPLIYGSFKGNYYDTYTTNYIGFNAATNKIVGNIEGSASKLDTPINVTLYSSTYYPSSYTTTFDGSTNLNIQIPAEFENTIKTIEKVTAYALIDLNEKCSYNMSYSYNVYNNLSEDINNYSKKTYINDIIPANQSGQNTSYFFPLIYGSFKGNYYDTYTTNYVGFNAATNKIVGNIEGSASKLDTPINVTLYSSSYYPSSYTTTFDGSTNLNIQIPEEFENTIKTIEEVTSYALNDLNDKCSYNISYSYNIYNTLYEDIHNYTQLSQGIANDDTVTIYETLTVTEEWMDSGIVINPTTFPKGTGTYAIQISHGNLNSPDANGYASIYSGMISIYTDSTSSTTDSEEIILHRAGHSWSNRLYIRTMPTSGGTSKIQIASSKTWTQSSNITFKFRKLI